MKEWIQELCPEIAEWQAELIAEQCELRVAAEREACAKIADEHWVFGLSGGYISDYIANAIRTRGDE